MNEPNQADKDRDLSFSIINYLSASLRGKIAALTLLGQFQNANFDIALLEATQAQNEKANIWTEGFFVGETLFSSNWSTPETFEAQSALGLLSKLRLDLSETSTKLKGYLNGEEPISSASAQWIFSILTRSAYSRDSYIRGFINFAQAFNKPEIAKNYGLLIAGSEERIFSINRGIEIFKAANYDLTTLGVDFLNTLLSLCEDLPEVFKTQIHDLNLLAANFKGGISAENLGFSKEDALSWQAIGMGLVAAGYWHAYGFTATEALAWFKSGAPDPAQAFAWRINRFDPQNSADWIKFGLTPDIAKIWGEAGLTPEETRQQLEQGYLAPNQPPVQKIETEE